MRGEPMSKPPGAGPDSAESDSRPGAGAIIPALARAQRIRGFLLAVGGTSLVSANFVTVKYALSGFNIFTLLPLWYAMAAVESGIYLIVYGVQWRSQVRRNFWPLLGLSLCNGAAGSMIYLGLAYLDPTVTAFLARSGVLYSILLAYIFLSERFSFQSLSGTTLVLGGIGVITYASSSGELLGIGLVLVGYIFSSLSFFLGKKVTAATNPVVLIWMRSMGSLAVVIVIAIISGQFNLHFSAPHLAVVIGGSLIGPFAGQALSFYAMRYIGLSELETLRATQPLFVMIYSLVFLGMLPSLRQGLGGVVVIAGVMLLVRSRSVQSTALPLAGSRWDEDNTW